MRLNHSIIVMFSIIITMISVITIIIIVIIIIVIVYSMKHCYIDSIHLIRMSIAVACSVSCSRETREHSALPITASVLASRKETTNGRSTMSLKSSSQVA